MEYIGCVVVSACSGDDGGLRSLLQVAVDLEAVVSRVCHRHVTVGREGQALGAIKGVRRCVDVGQEGPGAVEHLDPTVAPISNNDISVGIHGHACWSVELAVSLSMGAKFKQELPVCIVHLQERLNRKEKGG